MNNKFSNNLQQFRNTGFVKVSFPELHLEVYADVASDDNPDNLTVLKAHWDHNLGYQIGFKKFTRPQHFSVIKYAEYVTTSISNTYNQEFYRGEPNADNYYAKPIYDYFTYQGRRMGTHFGASSDDINFMVGVGNETSMTLVSYNKERHGIKSMTPPTRLYHPRIWTH